MAGTEVRTTGRGDGQVRSVADLVEAFNAELEQGVVHELIPVATGFTPLDRVLGGGVHVGGLTIVGGAPGVGKTILALQWARQMALDGRAVLYVCYEHDEVELLVRLLMMELEGISDEAAERVREAVATSAASAGHGLRDVLGEADVAGPILERIEAYAPNLHLIRASGAHTDVAAIAAMVESVGKRSPVVLVDYLQKVHWPYEAFEEAEKVTRVTEALKDLALDLELPVIALVAVEMEGLRERRLRMHHFRGSSALVFEADVALVLNEKHLAVAKAHLAYDPIAARAFRDWVVMSIEKNRGGPNQIDLEFRKDFERFRFNPTGGMVAERLEDSTFDEQ